ncbi:uncharacterized protein LOC134280296 [Saccostrea cucullata]|uniref:uncharacterized protein LOC134280296 n=1 Tax=Saccostrea cuccullata TaxID=36930 RepID=UPI002ED29C41
MYRLTRCFNVSSKMYVLTKSLSLTNILLCFLFDITASQDFSSSDNIDISIQRCTLNVNWTSEKADGCNLSYRVKLYQNETEIATIDTAALRYSKNGIDSDSYFRIEITPMLRCRNNSNLNGRKRVKSISSIPDGQSEYITKNISENVALECPLKGAYQPLKVEWQHILGINSAVVRTFPTELVNLQRVSYKDMGRYICTIVYTSCGTLMSAEKSRSFVTLSVNGPPFISSSQETVSVSLGGNLTLELNVISFPPPNSQVVIKNLNGLAIFREMVSFTTGLTPLQAFGKIIEVEGYNTKLSLMNISQEWIGTNTIIVSNSLGNHSFKITFYNYSDKEKNNFFGKIFCTCALL